MDKNGLNEARTSKFKQTTCRQVKNSSQSNTFSPAMNIGYI